jgi:hypothetical protein
MITPSIASPPTRCVAFYNHTPVLRKREAILQYFSQNIPIYLIKRGYLQGNIGYIYPIFPHHKVSVPKLRYGGWYAALERRAFATDLLPELLPNACG